MAVASTMALGGGCKKDSKTSSSETWALTWNSCKGSGPGFVSSIHHTNTVYDPQRRQGSLSNTVTAWIFNPPLTDLNIAHEKLQNHPSLGDQLDFIKKLSKNLWEINHTDFVKPKYDLV